jgi:hypothetical protein
MRIVFAVIVLALLSPADAQEFIGLTEQSIKEIMTTNKPEMAIDNLIKNDTYRYLKYRSRDDSETWVIFLDEKGRCKGVRITCDNSCFDRKLKELNELYRPGDEHRWTYRADGSEIDITLKRESCFFTVTYERSKYKG